MNIQEMVVTPKIAEMWLASNSNNRNISEKTVDLYAREMREGRWKLTHQSIAIYEDGVLCDGQHRLAAIVKSGCSIKMQVATGVKRDTSSGVDAHRARSIADIVKIGGRAPWIGSKEIQTVRMMYNVRKISAEEAVILCENVKESLEFAHKVFYNNLKGITASLRASIALAYYYGADKDRLAQFADAFYTGAVTDLDRDGAAIRCRDYFIMGSNSRGGSERDTDLRKTQYAISKFLSYSNIRSMRDTADEIYPRLNAKEVGL